jgi:hypothetical protein
VDGLSELNPMYLPLRLRLTPPSTASSEVRYTGAEPLTGMALNRFTVWKISVYNTFFPSGVQPMRSGC